MSIESDLKSRFDTAQTILGIEFWLYLIIFLVAFVKIGDLRNDVDKLQKEIIELREAVRQKP